MAARPARWSFDNSSLGSISVLGASASKSISVDERVISFSPAIPGDDDGKMINRN